MFTAIADRTSAIEVPLQSDDSQIRATVRGMRATLRKSLDGAIGKLLIEFNPTTHVELPSEADPNYR